MDDPMIQRIIDLEELGGDVHGTRVDAMLTAQPGGMSVIAKDHPEPLLSAGAQLDGSFVRNVNPGSEPENRCAVESRAWLHSGEDGAPIFHVAILTCSNPTLRMQAAIAEGVGMKKLDGASSALAGFSMHSKG